MFAVLDLSFFVALPGKWYWLACNFLMNHLYSNSMLAMLNSRKSLLERNVGGTEANTDSFNMKHYRGPKNSHYRRDLRSRTSNPGPPLVRVQIETETRQDYGDSDENIKRDYLPEQSPKSMEAGSAHSLGAY